MRARRREPEKKERSLCISHRRPNHDDDDAVSAVGIPESSCRQPQTMPKRSKGKKEDRVTGIKEEAPVSEVDQLFFSFSTCIVRAACSFA